MDVGGGGAAYTAAKMLQLAFEIPILSAREFRSIDGAIAFTGGAVTDGARRVEPPAGFDVLGCADG